jgi:hypothetical protein
MARQLQLLDFAKSVVVVAVVMVDAVAIAAAVDGTVVTFLFVATAGAGPIPDNAAWLLLVVMLLSYIATVQLLYCAAPSVWKNFNKSPPSLSSS